MALRSEPRQCRSAHDEQRNDRRRNLHESHLELLLMATA
jgi:hypothetical protein